MCDGRAGGRADSRQADIPSLARAARGLALPKAVPFMKALLIALYPMTTRLSHTHDISCTDRTSRPLSLPAPNPSRHGMSVLASVQRPSTYPAWRKNRTRERALRPALAWTALPSPHFSKMSLRGRRNCAFLPSPLRGSKGSRGSLMLQIVHVSTVAIEIHTAEGASR